MAHLSKPQITVVTLWSFGVVIARSGGLATVTCLLAQLAVAKAVAMRKRLRDLYRETTTRQGQQRAEWCAASGCAPWLGWILS